MNHFKSLAAVSLAVLFLAACGSSGIGDVLGGGSGTNNNNYELRGTVDYVDANSRSIYLTNVSGYNSSMLSSGGNRVRVYYDDRTRVQYQGNTYRAEDLERGDQVTVTADETGSGNNTLMADTVTVTQDVSGGTGSPSYGSSLRGTVRSIDTSRRTIELDRGYGSTVVVEYGVSTPVYFNNQTYRVADLERGDEIDIRAQDLGSGRFSAQDITVVRNVSGGTGTGTYPSSNYSTIRGTVRNIDTGRRTIELESANWISGFNTGAGTNSRMIISYPTNAGVEISGQMYPISGLERGDVIEVQVSNTGGSTYTADRIFLVRDVRK